MAELDKVLEAEKNILKIEEELGRLKNAADLLVGAQIKTDNVVTSAAAIVDATKGFIKSCGSIINRLDNVDIIAKLDVLEGKHREQIEGLGELRRKNSEELRSIQAAVETRLNDIAAKGLEHENGNSDRFDGIAFSVGKAIDGQAELARMGETARSQVIKQVGALRSLVILALVSSLLSLLASVAALVVR